MDRERRKLQADKAHKLQIQSGTYGALKATVLGLTAATLAHHTWPFFRRQTLAFKGFLVSTCTIFGLMVGADTALLRHEMDQRIVDDRLRREARIQLARQGKVGTEPEIARWMAQREEPEISKRKQDAVDS